MKNIKRLKAISFLLILLMILAVLSVGIYNIHKTIKVENELAAEYNVSTSEVTISKPVYQYYDIRTEVDSDLSFNVSYLSNRIKGSFGEGRYYLYTVAGSEEVIASIGMVNTYSYSPLGSGKMYKVYIKDKDKVPGKASVDAVDYVELYDYSTKEAFVLDLNAEQILYLIEEIISYNPQDFRKSKQENAITIDKDYECRFFVKEMPGLYFDSEGALSIVYDSDKDKYYISSDSGTTKWYKDISDEFQSTLKSQI